MDLTWDYLKSAHAAGKVGVCLLLAAFLALIGGGAQAQVQGPIYCNNQVSASYAATGTTQLVPSSGTLAGSGRIYVCGFGFYATSGTVTLQLEYGTGTTCGTGTTTITPAIPIPTTAPTIDSSPTFRGIETAPGTNLCLLVGGTTPVGVAQVFYALQ